jgi:hypothetical protein
MGNDAAEIARRLAQNAEAVCREYLSNGRREGGTWRVGDVDNTPGRSLMVRLTGPDSGPGACGHFTDFATGEHGDLLDVIARTCRLHAFRDVLEEARRFLSLPQPESHAAAPKMPPAPSGSPEAARRLFASAKPIAGTIAETYLWSRAIARVGDLDCLRFHAHCYYRANDTAPRESWPALIAAVTDAEGVVTGVLRTWLARDGSGKAPLMTPRRSMGRLLGHGVRLGDASDILAAGEGLETMLSLRVVLPALPVVAALSATHLAGFIPPSGLRRLYIAREQRPGRTPRRRDAGCACARQRHRSPRAHAAVGRLQYRPHHPRPRDARSIPARAAYAGGRGALPDRGPASGLTAASERARAGSVLAVGRARPSEWRWCGGTPRGAEKIAACWADARKVPHVVFKPDWTRHQKAAPFKRNDQLLEAMPIGVVVFPGSGVTDNLADKAKAMGIPLFDFRKAGGA